MRQIAILGLAVAVFSLVASPVVAQQRRQGAGPGAGMVGSVQFLLDNEQALGLSAEQVEAFTGLQEELVETTAPVMKNLRQLRDSGDMSANRDQAMALMGEMRDHDREAAAAALDLLDKEQRATAEEMLSKRQEEMRQRRRRGAPGN